MKLTRTSKNKIVAIIIGAIVVCALVAIASMQGCAGNMPLKEKTERIEAVGIKNISIDFPVGKLKVREATEGEREITIIERSSGNMSGKDELVCTVDSGTLDISYKMNPLSWLPFYWIGFGERELEVSVPSELLEALTNFKLHCATGDCEVGDLKCRNADVKVETGTVALKGIVVEDQSNLRTSTGTLNVAGPSLGACKVNMSTGKVNVSAAMKSLDLSVSTGQANITCTNADIDSINVDLSTGGVELQLPKDTGFDAAVDKATGNFNCEFEAAVRGETYKYGNAKTPIDIHIATGSVTLKPL